MWCEIKPLIQQICCYVISPFRPFSGYATTLQTCCQIHCKTQVTDAMIMSHICTHLVKNCNFLRHMAVECHEMFEASLQWKEKSVLMLGISNCYGPAHSQYTD
jgi:hypothetical protein